MHKNPDTLTESAKNRKKKQPKLDTSQFQQCKQDKHQVNQDLLLLADLIDQFRYPVKSLKHTIKVLRNH